MSKRIICDVCGRNIKKGEQVAVFLDGGDAKYTHVLGNDNKYDCDYRYMLEDLMPSFYSSPDDVDLEDIE